MIKINSTYNYIRSSIQLKQLIAICFVLMVGLKPLANITLLFAETKYELLENNSVENSNEKEKQNHDNYNDESENFINSLCNHQMIYFESSLSYFDRQIKHIHIAFDIHLPPPKIGTNFFFLLNNIHF